MHISMYIRQRTDDIIIAFLNHGDLRNADAAYKLYFDFERFTSDTATRFTVPKVSHEYFKSTVQRF